MNKTTKALVAAFLGGLLSALPDLAAGGGVSDTYVVQHALAGGIGCLLAALHTLPAPDRVMSRWTQLIWIPVATAMLAVCNQAIDKGMVIDAAVVKQALVSGATVAAALLKNLDSPEEPEKETGNGVRNT